MAGGPSPRETSGTAASMQLEAHCPWKWKVSIVVRAHDICHKGCQAGLGLRLCPKSEVGSASVPTHMEAEHGESHRWCVQCWGESENKDQTHMRDHVGATEICSQKHRVRTASSLQAPAGH